MRSTSSNNEDPRAAAWAWPLRLLHWLTVGLLVWEIVITLGPMNERGAVAMRWMPTHMSLGLALFALCLCRMAFRLVTQAPQPQRPAAVAVHLALYAILIALIATGWLGHQPMPFMSTPKLFGYWPIPFAPKIPWLGTARLLALHSALFWAFCGATLVHIGAALVHLLLSRDGVFERMTTQWLNRN
ncbi:cytochrome b [Mesorhizobium sp. M1A.F.Ca.IN.022.07.1.1]|uniref:cytochrome b n=1 Tax=Mesorhizobium sp. M1A.F.Ca.IN.022.07.1.1 TaxID=2496767 RepID=UPI000FCB532E|nr:cytochrome b/b6 domain-containing protein [Mesorhizobium sp. M1A.F.Ca.IN.022.07.1.1]RUV92049.1 cytochrome b [Mesorhizobium sp. M1A.F.Ca.IN.022.07.1.1]